MKFPSFHAVAVADFHPAPSVDEVTATKISVSKTVPKNAGGIGIPVGVDGDVPKELGLDRATLAAAGFEGKIGQSLVIPRAGAPALIAVGIGAKAERDLTTLRHAAAVFARAGSHYRHLVAILPDIGSVAPKVAAQALVEGVLLARYRYRPLKRTTQQEPPLEELTIVSPSSPLERLKSGIERGRVTARAAELARDLSNAPATLLTARRLADIAKIVADGLGARDRGPRREGAGRARLRRHARRERRQLRAAAPHQAHVPPEGRSRQARASPSAASRSSARASCTTPAASA